jgi:DNA-binding transcriptional LysR family regulator
MEYGQFKAFVQVARDGSFTMAAQSLGLTQPSVSTRIAVLESTLGSALFVRSGRKLSMTPAGEALLPYAHRSLTALQEGEQMVNDHIIGKRGIVSIVVLDTLAMSILPKPMQRFQSEHPEVKFKVHLCMPREILNLLYDGTAHLGLIRGPLWDRGVESIAHFQEPIHAIVSANHPLAGLSEISLNDVLEYPIYRVPLSPTTTAFVEKLWEQTRSGSGTGIVQLPVVMAIPMLLKSNGVAFLPGTFVNDNLASGTLVALPIPDMPKLYHEPLLVKLSNRTLDALHQELARLITAQWRGIRVDGGI